MRVASVCLSEVQRHVPPCVLLLIVGRIRVEGRSVHGEDLSTIASLSRLAGWPPLHPACVVLRCGVVLHALAVTGLYSSVTMRAVRVQGVRLRKAPLKIPYSCREWRSLCY